MYSFIPSVEHELSEHHIQFCEKIHPDHITLEAYEKMYDPGFAADNKLLDVYIDEKEKIIFIGMLRLPKTYRRKKIGTKIACHITRWAEENGYTVFLDSAGDSYSFWRKCGFIWIKRIDDFNIMGFGGDRNELTKKWKYASRIFNQIHYYH